MPESNGVLQELFFYLLAAVVAVPGARYLGWGPVPGYLLLGFIIGPWGLALIRDAGHIRQFSEFGVIVLMFLVGLQLVPARLKQMRHAIVRFGGAQIALCTVLVFIVAAMLNSPWREAFVAAMTLALCSSVIPHYYLQKQNQLSTEPGRFTQSILMGQQLAVIPILLLIPPLSLGAPADVLERWAGVLKAVVAIALVLFIGQLLLRHAYRFIADSRLPDVFVAFTLLIVVSVILLFEGLGLSMGLGAFLCGVLMAESEFHRELKFNIDPYKGLLLGMFFISVGMGIDFGLLLQRPAEILGLLLTLILIKLTVVYLIAVRAGIEVLESWRQAILLAQSGELTFLLLGVAAYHQAIPEKLGAVLTVVVAISLLLTPLLLAILRRYEPLLETAMPMTTETDTVREEGDTRKQPREVAKPPVVVVAGFGRVGQTVTRLLRSDGIETSVIDHDPAYIEQLRQYGFDVYYGNALRPELLRAAGAAQASVLVVAIDDREQALALVALARREFPQLEIVARAWDMPHYRELSRLGARQVQRETFASAVLMGEDVIGLLGRDLEEVERISEAFRDHDERVLDEGVFDELPEGQSQQRPLDLSRRGKHEMTMLLESDMAQRELELRIERGEEERG
ncbi:MAG: cation:proton antiporter [Gammaproteobacteria bacterium]|nr:cation:proton antiporter [Gammaproteobacteria bacterium]